MVTTNSWQQHRTCRDWLTDWANSRRTLGSTARERLPLIRGRRPYLWILTIRVSFPKPSFSVSQAYPAESTLSFGWETSRLSNPQSKREARRSKLEIIFITKTKVIRRHRNFKASNSCGLLSFFNHRNFCQAMALTHSPHLWPYNVFAKRRESNV
jgi:hypothetical protein